MRVSLITSDEVDGSWIEEEGMELGGMKINRKRVVVMWESAVFYFDSSSSFLIIIRGKLLGNWSISLKV